MTDAATREDGSLIELVDALWAARVPTSPPPSRRDDEARGLALLDLSLRLDHVTRLSESVQLVDRGHLRRTVSLDVDLDSLTSQERETLCASRGPDGQPRTVWVPVSRHSRRDLSPVVVRDSSGKVIPRQTTQETARLLAEGLSRLFRMLLETDGDGALEPLRTEQPRGRWLVQSALALLVDAGTVDHLRIVDEVSDDALRRPLPGRTIKEDGATNRDDDSFTIRLRAEAALRGLRSDTAAAFRRLVQIASREFLLVVSLPLDTPQNYLTYEAPLLPGVRQPSLRTSFVNSWLPVNREFTVAYTTSIPRTVRSYHLTFEVPEEIHVRRFLLSTDIDEPFVDSLVEDINAVASQYDLAVHESPKLLELELQGIGSRVAELSRRRMLNTVQYRRYLANCLRPFGVTPPAEKRPQLSAQKTLERLVDGKGMVATIAAFAGHYQADQYRQLGARGFTPDSLRRIASNLRESELGRDLTVDNDPREHGAHAHWRGTPADASPRSSEPIKVTAYLALADEPPALIESVARMVAGLLVVVAGIGLLSEWADGSNLQRADAIVAVLLLVPGILLTRLDIPSTNTVLGQLRSFQRRLAYGSLIATTGLGVVVAAGPDDWDISWAVLASVIMLAVLVACCGVEFVMRARRRRAVVPFVAEVPAWLRQDLEVEPTQRLQSPDVRFDAIEGS
jgi:hypothetical protein